MYFNFAEESLVSFDKYMSINYYLLSFGCSFLILYWLFNCWIYNCICYFCFAYEIDLIFWPASTALTCANFVPHLCVVLFDSSTIGFFGDLLRLSPDFKSFFAESLFVVLWMFNSVWGVAEEECFGCWLCLLTPFLLR